MDIPAVYAQVTVEVRHCRPNVHSSPFVMCGNMG